MLVLLDTNAYLRLAKRVKPLLGKEFGQKSYVLTILKVTEDEVRRSARLKFLYPWFNDQEFAEERLAKQVRLSKAERLEIEAMQSILRRYALENASRFTEKGRSPPSEEDCFLLAFGQVRTSIVVTDDLGMILLAKDFEIEVWHGHELLRKMRSAAFITNDLIRDLYRALEANGDLPATWEKAKHTTFKKVFGSKAPN